MITLTTKMETLVLVNQWIRMIKSLCKNQNKSLLFFLLYKISFQNRFCSCYKYLGADSN